MGTEHARQAEHPNVSSNGCFNGLPRTCALHINECHATLEKGWTCLDQKLLLPRRPHLGVRVLPSEVEEHGETEQGGREESGSLTNSGTVRALNLEHCHNYASKCHGVAEEQSSC